MDKGRKIFLFDVDGTLCLSQEIVKDDMLELLKEASARVDIGIVSGSDQDKIFKEFQVQSLNELYKRARVKYAFFENGVKAYKLEEHGSEVAVQSIHDGDIVEYLGEDTYQDVVNFCLGELSKIRLPVKRDRMIETRHGNINVSPIGRQCSMKERHQFAEFDKTAQVRASLCDAIRQRFGGLLHCSLGGQISIDLSPPEWTKKIVVDIIGRTRLGDIYFFGDNCGEGGNDRPVYEAVEHGFWVQDPEDCAKQIRFALESV